MADYVYMANPAKIREFLQKIQSTGVPDNLNQKCLSTLGFKSSNDRPLISVMKAIGFISARGEPTDRWQNYRNKQVSGTVMAEGIREHYTKLYQTYPNAHITDTETLRNFFSTHTKVSASTLNYIVLTFKKLCELADFSTVLPISTAQVEKDSIDAGQQFESGIVRKEKPGYTININIQLALPSDANKVTFDAFFESMKKHLID